MGCRTSKFTISTGSSPSKEQQNDFVEGVVCKVDEIKENELKTFDLDEGKVLLIKQNGNINALGTKCTHYGAPLVNSALGDGRIRCQWHGACFNIATGDIEDFPGLDSLPCYKVTIEGNNVKVRARKSELATNKRIKQLTKPATRSAQSIVVIGGGPAGATCVETLRQEGYSGQITMVCGEDCLPYDRVKVSKAMDVDVSKLQFRNESFYCENGIRLLKATQATNVDTSSKSVSLSNGQTLKYDKLFIATGCTPRKLDIPGANLKNVITLRSYKDANYTNSQLSGDKEVVILGSSFIGMEAANYCVSKVNKVTVIARDNVPFKPVLGERIGAALLNLFKEKGVEFIPGNGIRKIEGDGNGYVSSVELNDGQVLKADILIMGVGSIFNTEFLKNSGIQLQENGSIETNEYLQTNIPDIFVGGDIAYAPVWSHYNTKAAIGHYGLAHYHGRMAALNMLDKKKELKTVPFFWTMLFGKGVRYAGHGKFDDVVITGSPEEFKFAAYYLDGDEVVAMSSCGMDPIVSQFAEKLAQGKKLHRSDLGGDALAWAAVKT